jgi:hypothetical protein
MNVNALHATTVKLANYCEVNIPEDFIKENLESDKDHQLIASNEAYTENLLKKLDTDELFLKESVEKMLRANSIQKFSMKEEETKCLLKLYVFFTSKALDLAHSRESSVSLINLYYAEEPLNYKGTIALTLATALEKRIKNLKDFKIFDVFNKGLAKSVYDQSEGLKTFYKNTPLLEKNSLYENPDFTKNILHDVMSADTELMNYNKLQKLTFLINKKRSKKDPKYIEWQDFLKVIENENLDIRKISVILDNYALLSTLETLDWAEDKKCGLFHKIIKPFSLYQYSQEKTKYIDLFYHVKLKCAPALLEAEKLYQIRNPKYYARWCKEVKDQAKCMMYFNSDWVTSIKRCHDDKECSNNTPDGSHFFYFNDKNQKKADEVKFYTARIKYFQETLDIISFPLDAKPVCKMNLCKPALKYCEPLTLFESLVKEAKKQKFSDCTTDDQCILKEFHTSEVKASLYYAINAEYKDYDDRYLAGLYDEAIHDCHSDLGKNYFNTTKIEKKYDPQKMKAQCVKNKCEINFGN